MRVSPAASYRAATDEVFLFWTEEDSNQVLNGVYGQKFGAKGARKWGDSGLVVVALGADQQIFVQNVQIGTGAKVLGPVVVHRGARIGANAVVVRDVPENTTVLGAPVRHVPPVAKP